MLDQQTGHAAVAHGPHHLDRAVGLVDVHAGEGLVEQQHLGVGCEPDRDAERAQMPLRKIARKLVLDGAEAEEIEDLVGRAAERLLVAPRRRRADIEAGEARARAEVMRDDDAVARRHALEDRGLLEGAHDALAGDEMGREPRDQLAVETHLAPRRLHERRDQLEDGRLAGAVGADDRQDRVRLDVERDFVDRGQAAEALGEVANFQDRRRAHVTLSSTASAG